MINETLLLNCKCLGTQLLEVYALEIQMYTAQKNNKKLKALYDQV